MPNCVSATAVAAKLLMQIGTELLLVAPTLRDGGEFVGVEQRRLGPNH
jgi:hypothetical protein